MLRRRILRRRCRGTLAGKFILIMIIDAQVAVRLIRVIICRAFDFIDLFNLKLMLRMQFLRRRCRGTLAVKFVCLHLIIFADSDHDI